MGTGNDREVARIMKMDIRELLQYVLSDSNVVHDSYYQVLGNAVFARAKELGLEV